MTAGRQCQRTGVWLIPTGDTPGVRVAKRAYGPISAPNRTAGTSPLNWNRYDSPGRTTYIAADEVTAFTEVLGAYSRPVGAVDSQLERDAVAVGMTLGEYRRRLALDENEQPLLASGYLPERWRDVRSIHSVVFPPDAWLIDIEHAWTLRHIRTECADDLVRLDYSDLTNGALRGEDRQLTTTVATYLRDLELDTGIPAVGLQYGSKRTGAWSRAIWLGDGSDDGQYLQATGGEEIHPTRPGFQEALSLLEINPF